MLKYNFYKILIYDLGKTQEKMALKKKIANAANNVIVIKNNKKIENLH